MTTDAKAANSGSGQPPPAFTTGRQSQAPTGAPAIRPRTTTADASTPAFTVADVEQYVTTNSLPHALPTTVRPTIVKITFLTSQQVSTLLHTTTGLPDATLLCYVELQGSFTFAGPRGTTTPTFSTGFEVFDAHTGNLLISGGHP